MDVSDSDFAFGFRGVFKVIQEVSGMTRSGGALSANIL